MVGSRVAVDTTAVPRTITGASEDDPLRCVVAVWTAAAEERIGPGPNDASSYSSPISISSKNPVGLLLLKNELCWSKICEAGGADGRGSGGG